MPRRDILAKSCACSLFSISVVLQLVQFYWDQVSCNSGHFEEADPFFNLTEERMSRLLDFDFEMTSPRCSDAWIHLTLHSFACVPSRSLVRRSCGLGLVKIIALVPWAASKHRTICGSGPVGKFSVLDGFENYTIFDLQFPRRFEWNLTEDTY